MENGTFRTTKLFYINRTNINTKLCLRQLKEIPDA